MKRRWSGWREAEEAGEGREKMRMRGKKRKKGVRRRHTGKECTCLLGFLYKDKSPLAPMFSLLYWELQKHCTSSSVGLRHTTPLAILRHNTLFGCKFYPQLPHPFSIKKKNTPKWHCRPGRRCDNFTTAICAALYKSLKYQLSPFTCSGWTQCVWGLQSNSTRLHHHTVLPVLGRRGRRVIWFAGLTGVEWLIRNPPHEQTQTGAEAAAAFFLYIAGQCCWLVFGTNSLTSSECAGHRTDCEPSNSHGARILIMYWSRQLASSVHPPIKKSK